MSWQPLHMQRAEEVLREARHHLDLWLEVADARAPVSSRLPRLRGLLSQVDCALVLTHADLADARAVSAWRRVLPAPCFAVNARTDLPPAIRQFLRERIKRPPLRLFVAGLPNVGKSTLINRLVGGRSAPVGAKAGVTRTEQWVRRGDLALLDLPGILPRKPAIFAAVLGLVPEGQFPVEETALAALRALPGLCARYGIDVDQEASLAAVAEHQRLLRQRGELDIERAARLVLTDLRAGRVPGVQLEWPKDEEA